MLRVLIISKGLVIIYKLNVCLLGPDMIVNFERCLPKYGEVASLVPLRFRLNHSLKFRTLNNLTDTRCLLLLQRWSNTHWTKAQLPPIKHILQPTFSMYCIQYNAHSHGALIGRDIQITSRKGTCTDSEQKTSPAERTRMTQSAKPRTYCKAAHPTRCYDELAQL